MFFKMRLLVIGFLYVIHFTLVATKKYAGVHSDIYLNITQLIKKYKYPVETHEITTEDGYILTLFRIPHGKNGSGVNERALILMHGYAGQTEQFVVGGTMNASMAFYAADRGYDVWLCTNRGTKYGRKHVSLNPKTEKFWNFSFHEIGIYDLPATMDYILRKTGRKKLYYLGHSQGGTIFYVLCVMRPKYQEKFALASLLAPVIYTEGSNVSVILPFSKNLDIITKLVDTAQLYVVLPPPVEISDLLLELCFSRIENNICTILYKTIYGDSGEINEKMLPLIMRTIPSVGTHQLLHYSQNMECGRGQVPVYSLKKISGDFRQYDYGRVKNMEIYGSPQPPSYSIEKIDVPVAIYYSPNDILVSPRDVDVQCEKLAKCGRKFRMRNPKWNHLDYLAPKHFERDLGRPLMDYMDKFSDL